MKAILHLSYPTNRKSDQVDDLGINADWRVLHRVLCVLLLPFPLDYTGLLKNRIPLIACAGKCHVANVTYTLVPSARRVRGGSQGEVYGERGTGLRLEPDGLSFHHCRRTVRLEDDPRPLRRVLAAGEA